MSMLPAAISCSLGFQTWLRALSISVTCTRPRLPSLLPSVVASSRPAAPPPMITTRCGVPEDASGVDTMGVLDAGSAVLKRRLALAEEGRHALPLIGAAEQRVEQP